MQWLKYILLIGFFIAGILARMAVVYNESVDTGPYLIPWYDYIAKNGILNALGDNFTNYTPPYTYLLALMTAVPIPKIVAIKLIPIAMDVINSFVVYKIVNYKWPNTLLPLWAAAVFWCLPTVILNSAWWGQADSLYSGFLLITLYFLIVNRPYLAIISFSVSITFKLQAVFFGPVLAVLFLGYWLKPSSFNFINRIKLWYFVLIPIVYSILCLPVVVLGRKWLDVWTIYFSQATTFKALSISAANPYAFISSQYYQPVAIFGLIFATVSMFIWIGLTIKRESVLNKEKLMLIALASVALAPFLLPKMHDRYFYPADLLSLLVAFYIPRLWFLPLGFQLTSCLVYFPVLLGILPNRYVQFSAIINMLLIVIIVRKQLHVKGNN